ncbi:MAG: hypothetical protein IMF05_15720 [Proteobacteria bacterium]|nr:hypothetical protein [Pseudomonadota bacterium]
MRYMSTMLAVLCLGLALTGCEPEKKVDENSAGFEVWLQENGLIPLDEAQATELLSNRTLYGRYVGVEGGWIEFYSRGGVSVFQPDADQNPKRRLVFFGTWWAETDSTCFSYPERRLDCYRVYQDSKLIYFIRMEDSPDSPAGSLVVAAEEIKEGNTEKYPFVAN